MPFLEESEKLDSKSMGLLHPLVPYDLFKYNKGIQRYNYNFIYFHHLMSSHYFSNLIILSLVEIQKVLLTMFSAMVFANI